MASGGRRAGAGRPEGSKSVRPTIRAAFEEAFATLQKGPQALPKWAKGNPTEFYRLSSKLIPTTVEASVTVSLESLVAGSLDKPKG